MLCQETKTRYVIDGHDVCLDGRLAISHGDCVLDETVGRFKTKMTMLFLIKIKR